MGNFGTISSIESLPIPEGPHVKDFDAAQKAAKIAGRAARKAAVSAAQANPTSVTASQGTTMNTGAAYTYEKNFLTADETAALFAACSKLPFSRQKTGPWGQLKRHQVVSFSARPSARASYVGPHFTLAEAPQEIKDLAAKLSARTGKDINYLSCVLYEDGEDHMSHHQHKEDKGYDASVYIVSTGCDRPFQVRALNEKSGSVFIAESGSLIALSSDANDTHTHAVPKCKATTPRIAVNCKAVGPRVYSCRKGDESPEGAVYVGREVRDRRTGEIAFPDTPFGNHYHLSPEAFRNYAETLMQDGEFRPGVEALRGRDLLCWCKGNETQHCHARTWLELANRS
jgi:alkylated DNA repair dioxygenase AlkB